jgi:hypothetical protein
VGMSRSNDAPIVLIRSGTIAWSEPKSISPVTKSVFTAFDEGNQTTSRSSTPSNTCHPENAFEQTTAIDRNFFISPFLSDFFSVTFPH